MWGYSTEVEMKNKDVKTRTIRDLLGTYRRVRLIRICRPEEVSVIQSLRSLQQNLKMPPFLYCCLPHWLQSFWVEDRYPNHSHFEQIFWNYIWDGLDLANFPWKCSLKIKYTPALFPVICLGFSIYVTTPEYNTCVTGCNRSNNNYVILTQCLS